MKKLIIAAACLIGLTGCAKMEPICTATVRMSGMDYSVQVYHVKMDAKRVMYRAGYPFGWQYVSKANFVRSTCSK